ncbi:MAG: roadblock/LC7 domain-containing protein [Pyrinomonadaceae bacterium]|nr:roadblock/LC7 domain-containing protein [Pyrinomonadaceae bacterium]MCX7639964.1 roadblock/LC7 domain-containing protein [Pyrinomonadaceae bacterium]MDW8304136.1 roadblock/LC7 domain-containing protein [Acidobacteriota bacterium]
MFKEILQEAMLRTEGCLGALVMGMDGIPVEEVWSQVGKDLNLDIAVAEFSTIIKNVSRTNKEIGIGKLDEMTLSTESGIFVFRTVGSNYFLALVLSTEGNFGRARYELRRAELLLEKELVF